MACFSLLIAVLVSNGLGAQVMAQPTVSFRTSSIGIDESAGQVGIPILLSEASSVPISVSAMVRKAGTTAIQGDDYALVSTTVSFAPGEVEKTLLLGIVDDDLVESAESVELILDAAPGADIWTDPSNGLASTCAVQINDNDDKPYVVFTKGDVEVHEGAPSVRLFAQLSWPSTQEIVVPFMVDSGATHGNPLATIPDDLGPLPEAVRFAPGSTWQEIVIPLANDSVVEPNEEITVELCVPGSIISVGVAVGILLPQTFTVDPNNLPFRLNAGEIGATCRIVIVDDDASVPNERLKTWQSAVTSLTRQHLHGIVWTGNQYIAVGDSGTIITSPDAVTWTLRDSGTKVGLSSIAWSGSEAVVVGNGAALRSTDGVYWTVQNAPIPQGLINVAVLNQYGAGYFAPPVFTAHSSPFFEGAASVVWTGRSFVSMSINGVMGNSADGLVWKANVNQYWGSATDLIWTGAELLGITLSSNASASMDCSLFSSDGSANWTRRTSTLPTQWWNYYSRFLNGVLLLNGYENPTVQPPLVSASLGHRSGAPAGQPEWIAAFRGSVTPGLYSSVESSAFSSAAATQQVSHQGFDAVLWTGSQWVAVGDRIGVSADGITWDVPSAAGEAVLHGVVSGGGKTVAVGDYGAVVIVPEPSIAAIPVSLATMTHSMKDVVWAGNQYVAVGSGGAILTSPDGEVWTTRVSGTAETLHAVAWQERLVKVSGTAGRNASSTHTLVAVGNAGTVVTSDDDGISWSVSSSGTSKDLRGVVYAALDGLRFGQGAFIAVGADRTVLSSDDGHTWTVRSLPMLPVPSPVTKTASIAPSASLSITSAIAMPIFWFPPQIDIGDNTAAGMLEDVAWTGTQLVAVGSQDSVFTSPNGVTWTQRSVSHDARWTLDSYSGWTSNAVSDLKRVVWDGAKLVAAGNNGSVVTSSDGEEWEDQNTGLYIDYWGYPYLYAAAPQAVSTGVASPNSAASSTVNLVAGSSLSTITSSSMVISRPYPYYSQAETLRGLAVIPDGLVAVGSFGRVISSTDGSAWRTEISPTVLNLNAVAVHDGQTVAVGDQGLIIVNQANTSLPTISWTTTAMQLDEAETTVTLTAQISAALAQPLDVSVGTSGSAQADYLAPYYPQNMDFAVEGGTGTYQASYGTLHFDAGATTATINFIIHDDTQQEGDESIFATLMPSVDGTVQTWANRTASITIRANDQRPIILTESGDAIIQTGQSITFAVTAKSTNSDLSYQWYEGDYLNPLTITGATSSSLTVTNTEVSANRFFSVVVSNGQGTATSYFRLIVVDAGQGGAVTANEGEDLTLQVHLPTTNLWPWWHNDTGSVGYFGSSSSSVGSDGTALTLSRLQVSDSGIYTCSLQLPQIMYLRIWGWPGGPYREAPRSLDISFDLTVSPVIVPPVLVVVTPPKGFVGTPYSLALSATNQPARYSVSGLPTGLHINASTGLITGRPTQSGSFTVATTASNRAGASATQTMVIVIAPQQFSEAVGIYTGLITCSDDPTRNGRIDFTIVSNGKVTGKVIVGGKSAPFTSTVTDTQGSLTFDCVPGNVLPAFTCGINAHENTFSGSNNPMLNSNAVINLNTTINSNSNLTNGGGLSLTNLGNVILTRSKASKSTSITSLNFGSTLIISGGSLNTVGNGALTLNNIVTTTGALTAPTPIIAEGWRKVWSKTHPVVSQAGYYTALLAPPSALTGDPLNSTASRGSGYMTFSVKSDGTLNPKGKLADGSAIVCSTFMGPNGELALYQGLDAQGSSAQGVLGISPDLAVEGALAWTCVPGRAATAASASALPCTTSVIVIGSGYSSSRAQMVPGLVSPGNVIVTLSEGGLVAPVSVNMTLGNRGLATVSGANPYRVWLVFDAKTGVFSAGLTPATGRQRRVSAQGVFTQDDQGFLGGGAFANLTGPSGNIQITAAPTR